MGCQIELQKFEKRVGTGVNTPHLKRGVQLQYNSRKRKQQEQKNRHRKWPEEGRRGSG